MDDSFFMGAPKDTAPGIDGTVLTSLFAMGDDDLRVALSAQLLADFQRIRDALDSEDGYRVGRAAHELKGLAATVGANKLADMARSVDAVAEGMAAPALAVVIVPLQREIDVVQAHISAVSESTQSL